MDSKRELAFVGLFVLIAGGVLLATVLALSGVFGSSGSTYRASFPFAGGLEPGASVRYAGGPQVGRVEKVQMDPQDPARMEITFRVRRGIPIKTDSRVRIAALSLLGDNHLEIVPGSAQAELAAPNTVLASDPYSDFSSLTSKLNDLSPQAQQLLKNLNDSAETLKVTLDRINKLLGDENISGALAELRGMIAENRATVKSALHGLDASMRKVEPLLEDLRTNSAHVNDTLGQVDALISDNRADARQAISDLRQSLANVTALTQRLDQTLDVNAENIDDLLENLRHVSQNLKDFTNTIKTRPSTLIRSVSPREHVPGEAR